MIHTDCDCLPANFAWTVHSVPFLLPLKKLESRFVCHLKFLFFSFFLSFFLFSLVFQRAEETNQHHSFFFFLIVSVYVIEAMDMSFEVNDQFLNHYMGMLCYHDDGWFVVIRWSFCLFFKNVFQKTCKGSRKTRADKAIRATTQERWRIVRRHQQHRDSRIGMLTVALVSAIRTKTLNMWRHSKVSDEPETEQACQFWAGGVDRVCRFPTFCLWFHNTCWVCKQIWNDRNLCIQMTFWL